MRQNNFIYSSQVFLKIIITKCDEQGNFHEFQNNYYKVWQKVITKCDRYYEVRQKLFWSLRGIKKGDRSLLQSVTGVTMCDNYY